MAGSDADDDEDIGAPPAQAAQAQSIPTASACTAPIAPGPSDAAPPAEQPSESPPPQEVPPRAAQGAIQAIDLSVPDRMNQQRQAEWSLVTLSKVNLPDNASAEFCSAVAVNGDVSFQIMSWTIPFYANIVQSRLYVQVFQVVQYYRKLLLEIMLCAIFAVKKGYL